MSPFETENVFPKRLSYGHLAHGLGITERHVKRLIAGSPAFREAVGAYKSGKQWRIDTPAYMPAGVMVLCDRARKAVPSLARKKRGSSALESIKKAFGGKSGAVEIQALRMALLENQVGDLEADEICFMAQLIRAKYRCSITEVPKHEKAYFRWQNKITDSDITGHLEDEFSGLVWPPAESIRHHLFHLKKSWWNVQVVDVIKQLEQEEIPAIGKNICQRVYRSPDARSRGKIGVSFGYYRRLKSKLGKDAERLTLGPVEEGFTKGEVEDFAGRDEENGETATIDAQADSRAVEKQDAIDPNTQSDYEKAIRAMSDLEDAEKIRAALEMPI